MKASRAHISLGNPARPTLESALPRTQAPMLIVRLSGFKAYLCHLLADALELPELAVSLSLDYLIYKMERSCGV